jgi:anti-sigma regulatory factor (Ser/Thr protein kinase)
MPSTAAAQRDFSPEPRSAYEVRRFIERVLGDRRIEGDVVGDVVLVGSELSANVIRHAQTEFTVVLRQKGDWIRLEVSDGSSIIPAVEDLTESYRGLRMVEAVSEDWGVEATGSGKTVWAEFKSD